MDLSRFYPILAAIKPLSQRVRPSKGFHTQRRRRRRDGKATADPTRAPRLILAAPTLTPLAVSGEGEGGGEYEGVGARVRVGVRVRVRVSVGARRWI